MKKSILKLFTFIVALCFTFAISGCTGGGGTVETVPTGEAVQLFTSLIDFEDINFTATIDGGWLLSAQQSAGGSVDSRQSSYEDIVFKFDGDKMYMNAPNAQESYISKGYSIGKSYIENAWSDYYVNFDSESVFLESLAVYMDEIEGAVKETFGNIVSFNPSWVSAQKLDKGAYKLNLNTNLTSPLTAFKTAITENLNSPLGDLVDDILAIHYGEDFTVAQLVSDIKTNINSTSTLEDVVTFIGDEFGFETTSLVSLLRVVLADLGENAPSLDANFFALIQVESNEGFSNWIDNLVANYLNNSELTLNTFLETITEEESDGFLVMLKNVILNLENVTINNCAVNVSLTTNTERTKLAGISFSVNINVNVSEAIYIVQANADIAFSDFGTTEITLPTIDEENLEGFDLRYDLDSDDLTADTAKVISDVNLGDWSTAFDSNSQGVSSYILEYNSTNHTLTLSAEAVNYLLLDYENELYFSCGDSDNYMVKIF